MSNQDYQVLARKWRPHAFKDMVGQEHILRMIANALEQKRLHHAYLLTGTRGVGKTTLARILAKCLNCETGITSTPCDACHACKAIDSGKFLDLYEIDAASRTKVEDTRELLDNVPYPPTQGRYKVYLIDEVHMLSNHSFNALLKTLEEPPEHVKFVLATTDPKRLPITILSRCLQFHLKRITPEQISGHLKHICETEQLTHDITALDKLAHAADGSMRDALSLLDQAIAYGHGSINLSDVHAMLGCMAQDDLLPLLRALAAQDGRQLFAAMAELSEHAPDFHQALEEMIHVFHQLAIAQIVPDTLPAEHALVPFTKQFSPEDVQLYYQIALLGRRDLSLTPSPQQGFEMTMVRMLAFKPGLSASQNTHAPTTMTAPPTAVRQPQAANKTASAANVAASRAAQTAPVANVTAAAPVVAATNVTASTNTASAPKPTTEGAANWRDMLPKLGLSGMAYALAENCSLALLAGSKLELTLSAKHEPMLSPKLKERLTEAVSRYFQQAIQLVINITADEIETPAKQHQAEKKQELASATQTILQDPKIQKLVEMYDATVEVSLIT